jgi:hypothetical protein
MLAVLFVIYYNNVTILLQDRDSGAKIIILLQRIHILQFCNNHCKGLQKIIEDELQILSRVRY